MDLYNLKHQGHLSQFMVLDLLKSIDKVFAFVIYKFVPFLNPEAFDLVQINFYDFAYSQK